MVKRMNLKRLSRRRALTLAARLAGAVMVAILPLRRASAHAMLRGALPPVGSTPHAAPAEVWLTFSEAIDVPLCSVQVTDGSAMRVDDGKLRADPLDAKRMVTGLKPLQPGTYRVDWKATSVDTHKTEGSYGFVVLGVKP